MCGIAGIISFAQAYAPTREQITAMSAAIAHRGPDGEGILEGRARGASFALAHRRLAILDPDPRSNQPFTTTYQGRTLHLVFNGEIYNFRELRVRLERELVNFPWRTTGDTEVLLAAYFAWGARCADEFLGMFAFAIVDETHGTVFTARDRMGQKPLFVSYAPGYKAMAFASEIAALCVLPWVDQAFNERALKRYLAFGYTDFRNTFYEGIDKHQRGWVSTFDGTYGSEETASRPIESPAEGDSPDIGPVLTRIRTEQAVESQLVSDVPLGCFLSGGVDSSIVALCASRRLASLGEKLHTFTIKFGDARYDESAYAAEVARHLGTIHHEFAITPDVASDLPKLAQIFGEPFADSSLLPTYYLARETRKHVKVALSGDGADELFAGYDRYRALMFTERYYHIAKRLPLAALGRLLTRGHPKSRRARLGRLLESWHLPGPMRYEAYIRLFSEGLLGAPGLYHMAIPFALANVERPNRRGRPGQRQRKSWDPLRLAIDFDQDEYLPEDLLTKVDRASMAVALEVRSPFMDHRLVEYARAIPAEQHLARGPKTLLRDAFAGDLPASVFARRKMGFALPIGDWFRTSLRSMTHDLLLSPTGFCVARFGKSPVEKLIDDHQSARVDHSQRLFALLMLELWARQSRNKSSVLPVA